MQHRDLAREYMNRLHDQGSAQVVVVGGRAVHLWALNQRATSHATRRLLLIHGNPAHFGHFEANVEFLRTYGDVAMFDLPGFGSSPDPGVPLSLDFFADVADAYAESLGWSSNVDVIGQSHGGAVAQTLAARHPQRVRTLVLLGTIGVPAHLAMRLAMLPGAAALTYGIARRATTFPFDALARAFARVAVATSVAPDAVPDDFLEQELQQIFARPEIQRSCVRANDGDPTLQLRAQAARIRVPVLMLHGRDDRLVPIAYARRLSKLLAESAQSHRLEELDGGHMFHLTRPSSVHASLRRWFDEHA